MSEPNCPYRIVEDIDFGFNMGCVGGAVFQFLRGMWYASKRERFMGGIMLLKKGAPILRGNFAIWAGVLFSVIDYAPVCLKGFINYPFLGESNDSEPTSLIRQDHFEAQPNVAPSQ